MVLAARGDVLSLRARHTRWYNVTYGENALHNINIYIYIYTHTHTHKSVEQQHNTCARMGSTLDRCSANCGPKVVCAYEYSSRFVVWAATKRETIGD